MWRKAVHLLLLVLDFLGAVGTSNLCVHGLTSCADWGVVLVCHTASPVGDSETLPYIATLIGCGYQLKSLYGVPQRLGGGRAIEFLWHIGSLRAGTGLGKCFCSM